jgi:hypothetical protein
LGTAEKVKKLEEEREKRNSRVGLGNPLKSP